MTTYAGRNTRTIVGYVVTLLEYPRWVIEREVDFTDCHLGGGFNAKEAQCSSCNFGEACCWLNANRNPPSADASLAELLVALRSAAEFLRSSTAKQEGHMAECDCDSCHWLREATSFLRQHRHRQ